jgi:hypothetical protein
MLVPAGSPQVSVIDSGSTNRPGVTVTVDEVGNAAVQPRNGPQQSIKLDPQLCARLLRHVQTAGTLSALPAARCAKSISFGSSLYVEVNGVRSPDISCTPQSDQRAAALQKDANEILASVRSQLGLSRLRPVRPVKPVQ